MSWRVVVISSRCKLDLSMNYMVVRGDGNKRVSLNEIAVLILENNAVSMTGCLLSALIEKKIRIILCDSKRNPQAEVVPYYGCHNDALKIKMQLQWDSFMKECIWTKIVTKKIENQAILLRKEEHVEAELLEQYVEQIQPGDVTNREGHAAKVYFNALFGKKFSRDDEENVINAALNYGYSLILSAVNREVTANGYLTQLGLWHDNHFNLSCDIMEPLRIIVDEYVVQHPLSEFSVDEKHQIVTILNQTVRINNTEQNLMNAIKIYVKSIFDALNEQSIEMVRFMRMIVFFDLPTKTTADLREYRKFRKLLITNGFVMMQESVYTKMLLNQSVKMSVLEVLKKNKPPQGLVQAITVTEKQFAGAVNIVGESVSNVIDTDERLIIL